MDKNKLEQLKKYFHEEFQMLYQNNYVSSFFYGNIDKSINASVILLNTSIEEIEKAKKLVKKWKKQKVFINYFFNQKFITDSVDVFPIEYLNMKLSHINLGGEDIIANIKIKKKDLRTQIERELRGLVLHFRSEYVEINDKLKNIKLFLNKYLDSFYLIFNT